MELIQTTHTNIRGGIMENNLKPYKIEVGFYATDWEDVEDFIQSMSHKDWLNEVQEEEE